MSSLVNIAPASVTLLHANSGTDTTAAATNVDTKAISGLTAKDTLIVQITMASVTQATSAPSLYNTTDALTIVGLTDAGSIAAGTNEIVTATVRQRQTAATAVSAYAVGGHATSTTVWNNPTFTTNWTGSWTVALRHAGVTAGGTFQWSWAVYKIAGQ